MPDVSFRRVVLGALLPLAAFAVQWPLWFVIKPLAWFLFFPAVFLGSWLGNRASGFFATVLSSAIVWWFFLPPQFQLAKDLNAWLSTAVFMAMGLMFTLVHERLRRANRSTAAALDAARRTLHELEASQKEFRELFEQAPDGIFVADPNGCCVDVNTAGCRLAGRTRDEIVGRPVGDFVSAEESARLQPASESWPFGGTHTAEWTLLRGDGTRVAVEVSTHGLRDGRWQAFIRDISERRRADERLRQAATVFESTNEAIMVTDAARNLVAVNRAFEKITGYRSEEVIGRNPRFLRSGRQDDEFYERMWRLLGGTGQWQGEIWDRRRSGDVFPAWENISAVVDKAGRVTHYVSVMSDISEVKQAEERLAHLAHHDALTGLPNRLRLEASIEDAIEYARRHRGKVAVLFLDLDRFKLVNDSLGHLAGDHLLKVVAERLRGCVRAQDTVARLGGDEFIVVLAEVEGTETISQVAGNIVSALRAPVPFERQELDVSTSIGISVFPDDGSTVGDLLKAADTALYRAKERGRDTYEFYTAEMTRRALERLSLETRLRRAVGRGELSLHYQPQLSSANGELTGVEALLRWHDPAEGSISPGRFVPVAEESGLIDALGTWVIEQAFAQLRAWLDAGLNPGRMAINLSGRQILLGNVVEAVSKALQDNRLDSERVRIELEVTESVLQSMERSVEVLRKLRGLGVHVAIDDFGTGYSSLSVLKDLPIEALKIDQLFVRGIPGDRDSAAITRAIVAMAHNLGLRVVAEGVESEEQLEFLRELGCDEVQGFLLGYPVSAQQMTEALTRGLPARAAGRLSGTGDGPDLRAEAGRRDG